MKLRPIVGLSALFSYPLSRQRRAATSSAPKSRSNEPQVESLPYRYWFARSPLQRALDHCSGNQIQENALD